MIITKGIPQDEPLASRLEIRTFLKDEDLTNLFLLALERMMKVPQDDLRSWFQLAAIHGRPYLPYDNVGDEKNVGSFGGYCSHTSILFPTWHRPSVALLEQLLGEYVRQIAQEFSEPPDQEKYVQVGKRFRLPYWDWAAEASVPDIIAQDETVLVYKPPGRQVVIANPLYCYEFDPSYVVSDGPGLPEAESHWVSWKRTLRHPLTTDEDATSTPSLMQEALRNEQSSLRTRTYNLFAQNSSYLRFSHDINDSSDIGNDGLDSIEAIHNRVHILAGGRGHFGEVDWAAYDPIFWLHHSNVDRLFALFQVLNPYEQIMPLPSRTGNFTRRAGEFEDGDTGLTPFRRTADTFWTSKTVWKLETFNYTYPELAAIRGLPKEEQRRRIIVYLNKLYGESPTNLARYSVFREMDKLPDDREKWSQRFKGSPKKKKYLEWFIDITAEKYAVGKGYSVHIFLGEISSEPSKWGLDPNRVGSHSVFANNIEKTGCDKCRRDRKQGIVVAGTVYLTDALWARFGAHDLSPERIVPFLGKELKWRVQKVDGTVVDNADIPSLNLIVGTALVESPGSFDELPGWKAFKLYPEVIEGRW
ncbi:hypothetical protein M422DRAFT_222298 [Sphaerobolus stellatus SS14]|nr:hypothetical protein M422DRAFT_222298 [Sphaerobolus stellatus SS14]